MRSIFRSFPKRTFFLCICIFNIARGVFNVQSLPSIVINILCSHAFSTIQELFSGDFFLYKIILEPEKKSQKIKSQNGWTLFPEIFLELFFPRTFWVPKFRTLFPKTFFQITFLAVTDLPNHVGGFLPWLGTQYWLHCTFIYCRQSNLSVCLMGRAGSLTSLHLEHVSGMDSCDLRTIGQYLLALGKQFKFIKKKHNSNLKKVYNR